MKYDNLDVIVPTYNRAKYLRTCLTALCESVAEPRKVIVLNNASTDNTIDVVNEICLEYPDRNIEVITNPKNLGNAGNFIKTQEIANNEYVAIFHDDDAVHPEYIARAMKVMTEDKTLVLCTGGGEAMFNVNHDNFPMLPNTFFYYPKNFNVFLQLCVGRHTFFSAIYKTDAYKSIKYNPKKYGKLHDIVFLMDVASLGNSVMLQGCCIRWRQSLLQDSSDLKSGPFKNEIIGLIKYMKNQYMKEISNEKKSKKAFDFCFRILLYNFSYFIYDWSKISRFTPWENFKKELQKEGIFEKNDFDEFELYIDSTLNPFVINFAKVMREKYTKTYKYRLGFN